MIGYVFIDEHSGGGREFKLAGEGGDGKGFRVVRDDNAIERDVCFEVFLQPRRSAVSL